jgi:hypothetical protein
MSRVGAGAVSPAASDSPCRLSGCQGAFAVPALSWRPPGTCHADTRGRTAAMDAVSSEAAALARRACAKEAAGNVQLQHSVLARLFSSQPQQLEQMMACMAAGQVGHEGAHAATCRPPPAPAACTPGHAFFSTITPCGPPPDPPPRCRHGRAWCRCQGQRVPACLQQPALLHAWAARTHQTAHRRFAGHRRLACGRHQPA